ncbi:MAG TPA: hypothetical protein VHA74_00145, partial [Candidatus Dojkabacteria bacterium]|nr:hypothetical protein [Candidatus Dojkabacteria bacterium]
MSFSRRDTLKLAAVAAATTIIDLGIRADQNLSNLDPNLVDINIKEDPYDKIDFVTHPEFLTDHPELKERISEDFEQIASQVDGYWRRGTVSMGQPEEGIKKEAYLNNAQELVDTTIKLGRLLQFAQSNHDDFSLFEIKNKYNEYATYLKTILVIHDKHRNDTNEQIDAFINDLPLSDQDTLQNIQTSQINSLGKNFKRSEVIASWNFDWSNIILGDIAINPIYEHYTTQTGDNLLITPKALANQYLNNSSHKVDIEQDEWLLKTRPKEVTFTNFDPVVQTYITNLLSKIGLDRGIDKLVWENATNIGGNTMKGSPITTIEGPGVLDATLYNKYKNAFDQIVIHEGFHDLMKRANNLSDEDQITFRNYWYQILARLDPLSDMKKLFNPEGTDLDSGPYKDFSQYLNDFATPMDYLRMTENYVSYFRDNYLHESLGIVTQEFKNGLNGLANINIDSYFSANDSSTNITDIFKSLEAQLPSMDTFSKLVAQTILDNKVDISPRKRSILKDDNTD